MRWNPREQIPPQQENQLTARLARDTSLTLVTLDPDFTDIGEELPAREATAIGNLAQRISRAILDTLSKARTRAFFTATKRSRTLSGNERVVTSSGSVSLLKTLANVDLIQQHHGEQAHTLVI